MPNLILLRHGQSQWNLENRFTGWEDVDLSELGRQEAKRAGEALRTMQIDKVYTSMLKRAIATADLALEAAGKQDLETVRDPALNERHYGDLQGLNKAETAKKYGDDQVHIWRRSFDIAPPGEGGESLKMCMSRVMPYFEKHILSDLKAGKNLLVVAHGNSLRALLFNLDKHTEETIMDINIPTGVPLLYEMEVDKDGTLHVAEKRELVGDGIEVHSEIKPPSDMPASEIKPPTKGV
jgi:2,3-bisphosphoglycerate-dependent phosphoglycerate mutase